REQVHHWTTDFDWRAQERSINELPQFRADFDGTPIHFVHERGRGPEPLPLILSHGWPWTFWDWAAVVRPLTDPVSFGGDAADAFDVVVPSLPGFTFSTPLSGKPVTVPWIAGLWDRLMTDVLGYPRYGAAGGDWGEAVTVELDRVARERLAGMYL